MLDWLVLVLLLVITLEGVHAAPVNLAVGFEIEVGSGVCNTLANDPLQNEAVRAAYDVVAPGAQQICLVVRFDYDTCTARAGLEIEKEHRNETALQSCLHCNFTFIWATFDPASWTGKYLFRYGAGSWQAFEFRWLGPCVDTPVLNNNVSTLMMRCGPFNAEELMTSTFKKVYSVCTR